MRLRIHFLFILLAGGILLSGCKSPDGKTTLQSKSSGARASHHRTQTRTNVAQSVALPETVDASQRAEAMARFAAGMSHEINGQVDEALENFYRAALADSENQMLVTETTRRLLQANQNDKAIEVLRKAIRSPKATGSLHAVLARAYFQSGQTNQAFAAGQSAIKRNPEVLAGYQTLADIYFQTGQSNDLAKVMAQAGRQPKADIHFLITLAETYTRYIQQQPKLADALKPSALEVLNRAAAFKPQNGSLQHRLADGFNALGDRDKAAEIYLELLARFSESPILRDPIREKLANIYLLSSDKQRAAELLRAIVRDNPTRYPQAFYVLGTLAFDEKKYADAADHFSKAIVIVPDLEQAYYDLAAAQLNSNQPQEALVTLEKSSQKFPRTFIGEFYAGLASQKIKDYSRAVKHYTAAEVIAKTLEPQRLDNIFYFQLGAACERNRDYEQAEKYFQKALELKPNDPETMNYLGYMHAERGTKLEESRELIERALKIEPDNAAYLDSMGWVLFKLNKPEQALSFLQKALENLKQPDPILYDHLGDVYNALKQPDKARQAWEKSLSLEPSQEIQKKLSLVL